MFDSINDLGAKLAATGYFIDPVMTQVVFLAAKLQKPLLLEGPAGSGKARSLAESIGDTQFVSVLDRLHIGSMTTISNLEALKHLVSELEGLAGQPAA